MVLVCADWVTTMNTLRSALGVVPARDRRLVTIYRDPAYCANWPMTGGMWRWSDGEIAVGFTRLAVDYRKKGATDHLHLDTWGELCLVRSFDDGETFNPTTVQVVVHKRQVAIDHFQEKKFNQPQDQPAMDFTRPDTILMSQYVGEHVWAEDYSQVRFWSMILASSDRGKTFAYRPCVKKPRQMFSAWGLPSYVVRADGSVLLFTDCVLKTEAARPPQSPQYKMHIYADILEDGGRSWRFHGLLDLERRDADMVIHPSVLDLGDGAMLMATRHQTPDRVVFVMLFRSDDHGRNWRTVGRVTDLGGTPHLLRLRDGRIVLTYERRWPPYGIRARVSLDEQGWRWGPEIVLRDDAANGDIGYSRSVQRADGQVLTASYINLANDIPEGMVDAGGVRHIAGVIWNPE